MVVELMNLNQKLSHVNRSSCRFVLCSHKAQSVVHCIYNWQYVVLSSDRKVIFENGKTYNRPSAIVIVIKRMKNLSQVIKAKNDN